MRYEFYKKTGDVNSYFKHCINYMPVLRCDIIHETIKIDRIRLITHQQIKNSFVI